MRGNNLTARLIATLPVLAFCVPVCAQTLPITSYKDPVTGAIVTTMVLPPVPPATDPGGRPLSLVPQRAVQSSRATWIPGHYDWDSQSRNYVWTGGAYLESPQGRTRWVAGHWDFQPAGWVWLNGHWE